MVLKGAQGPRPSGVVSCSMRISTGVAILLIGVVGVYGFFRAQSFIFGPTLIVEYPQPHQHVPQSFTLRGSAENSTYLSINDQRIYPDEKGFFARDLVLPAGYTIVKLYAHNRQKRERIIYLPIYIQPHGVNKNKEGSS